VEDKKRDKRMTVEEKERKEGERVEKHIHNNKKRSILL